MALTATDPQPPGLAIVDWWVRQADLRLAVVKAARTYADFTHGNLTQAKGYRRRQEARDALLDALEALDELEETGP